MTNKIEWVKLEARTELVPKEFRILLANLATQLHATGNYTFETSVLDARELLYVSGITEALVPKQHADSLAPAADADDERKAKALDVLYPKAEDDASDLHSCHAECPCHTDPNWKQKDW